MNEKTPWIFCLATPGKSGHHWLNPWVLSWCWVKWFDTVLDTSSQFVPYITNNKHVGSDSCMKSNRKTGKGWGICCKKKSKAGLKHCFESSTPSRIVILNAFSICFRFLVGWLKHHHCFLRHWSGPSTWQPMAATVSINLSSRNHGILPDAGITASSDGECFKRSLAEKRKSLGASTEMQSTEADLEQLLKDLTSALNIMWKRWWLSRYSLSESQCWTSWCVLR